MNRYGKADTKIKLFSFKTILTFFVLIFCSASLYSQNKYSIDYYGIVADGVDDNMSKMTSDLYYTQLCEINSYTVQDKRTAIKLAAVPETQSFSDAALSLYAVITKKENSSKWISTISLYDSTKKALFSESREYDSFYKILMEPKATLKETIQVLLSGTGNSSGDTSASKATAVVQSTEFLSGTWGGEDNIDKIVIMRGGRGFVIFKNGASMNITVELANTGSGQNIIITQNGKANASFFTEIPRELALKEAVNAQPIKWVLEMNDEDTLSGIKNTLILSDGTAQNGSLAVTWKRKS